MVFNFIACCGSFIGNGRNKNEDNFYFNKKRLPADNMGLKHPVKCCGKTDDSVLFAVFDGMGGESRGEQAAFISSGVFADEYKKLETLAIPAKQLLCEACEKANAEVNRYRNENQLKTVGTTVAALCFLQNEVVACNVGDSKLFRIRENKMLQISEDHTDEKIMAAIGISKKPVLLQYLGVPSTEMAIEPYISKGDIHNEDTFILCTDGVTDLLELSDIYTIVHNNDAEASVIQLLAEVDKKGGDDNATVIVIKFSL